MPYYQYKDNISVNDGFLLYNSRLIIPAKLQMEMLHKIHEGHLGIQKCRDRAKQSIWWLGLSSQLRNLIENCPECVQERKNIHEPFVKQDFPDRPWQKVGMDLFKLNKWYLIITDYYSRYFEICPLKCMTEEEIIQHCKTVFARFGVPDIVRSDCGTQFASGFQMFAKDFDFSHITSSPKFSQSNGAAHAAVKIAKNIIMKCKEIDIGLLAYRTTPLENGYTPAELMFSRKIKSRVPTIQNNLGTFKEHDKVVNKETIRKDYQAMMYNKGHRSKKLSDLNKTDKVWIIDMRLYGEITDFDRDFNSYLIKTEKGNIIRRNRWHIVPALYKHDLDTEANEIPIIPEDVEGETTRQLNVSPQACVQAVSTANATPINVTPNTQSVSVSQRPSNERSMINVSQLPNIAATNSEGALPRHSTDEQHLRRSSRVKKIPTRYNQ